MCVTALLLVHLIHFICRTQGSASKITDGQLFNGTERLVINGFDTIAGPIPENYWYNLASTGSSVAYEYVTSPRMEGNGAIRINYSLQQTQTWGAYASLGHVLLGMHTSYSLAGCSQISLSYLVERPGTLPGRGSLRLVLMDSSNCMHFCDNAGGFNLELYYSFLNILDEMPQDPGWNTVTLGLRGSSDPSDPFWRSGWAGEQIDKGNGVLDLDSIKAFELQFCLDGAGSMGDVTSGSILLDGLQCTGQAPLASAFGATRSWSQALAAGQWLSSPGIDASLLPQVQGGSRRRRSMMVQTVRSIAANMTWANASMLTLLHQLPGVAYYDIASAKALLVWSAIAFQPAEQASLTLLAACESCNQTSDATFLLPAGADFLEYRLPLANKSLLEIADFPDSVNSNVASLNSTKGLRRTAGANFSFNSSTNSSTNASHDITSDLLPNAANASFDSSDDTIAKSSTNNQTGHGRNASVLAIPTATTFYDNTSKPRPSTSDNYDHNNSNHSSQNVSSYNTSHQSKSTSIPLPRPLRGFRLDFAKPVASDSMNLPAKAIIGGLTSEGPARHETRTTSDVVYEDDILLNLWHQQGVTLVNFLMTKELCGHACEAIPGCIYFAHRLPVAVGNCALCSSVASGSVVLADVGLIPAAMRNNLLMRDYSTSYSAGWLSTRRPKACGAHGVCNCSYPSGGKVNCSSPDIGIFPSIDGLSISSLSLVGSNIPFVTSALLGGQVMNRLARLELGPSVVFLSEDVFDLLPELQKLMSIAALGNMISDLGGLEFYSELCCRPKYSIQVGGVSLWPCVMDLWKAGVDCVQEPNWFYSTAVIVDEYSGVDKKYGWAADSGGDCCELCSQSRGCAFWVLDQRLFNAEPTCQLLISNAGRVFLPQEASSTGGPGYISGFTPQQRVLWGNVSLAVSLTTAQLTSENNYSLWYDLKLVGQLTRGSVWITPVLPPDVPLVLTPRTVALYELGPTSVTFTVQMLGSFTRNQQLVIHHDVQGCDEAWSMLSMDPSHAVTVTVVPDCPVDSYCPPDSDPKPCPPGSGAPAGGTRNSVRDCICRPGLVDWSERAETPVAFDVTPCGCEINSYLTGLAELCRPCGANCDAQGCSEQWLHCDWKSPSQVWSTKFLMLARNISANTSNTSDSNIARLLLGSTINGNSSAELGLMRLLAVPQPPIIQAGFWAVAPDPDSYAPDLPAIHAEAVRLANLDVANSLLACYNNKVCLDGGGCAAGREGPACGRCADGFFGGADAPCHSCEDKSALFGGSCSIAGGIVLLVAFFCNQRVSGSTDQEKLELTDKHNKLVKDIGAALGQVVISVRYIQALGIMSKFNIHIPDLKFLNWARAFLLDTEATFGIACFLGSNFTIAATCKLVLPVVLLLLVPLGWLLNNVTATLCGRAAKMLGRQWPFSTAGRDELMGLLILIFVLFFQTLVKQMVQFLECVKMPNGSLVVNTRRDVLCSTTSGPWASVLPASIACLVTVTVGSYVVLWVAIYRNVLYGDRRTAQRVKRRFVGQLGDFRQGAFWWLMVINTKEIAFALTGALFPADGYAQTLWSTGWVAAYCVGTYVMHPFESFYNNTLEMGLQVCIILQIMLGEMSGFGTVIEQESRNRRNTLVLIVNLAGLFGLAGSIMSSLIAVLRRFVNVHFCPSRKVPHTGALTPRSQLPPDLSRRSVSLGVIPRRSVGSPTPVHWSQTPSSMRNLGRKGSSAFVYMPRASASKPQMVKEAVQLFTVVQDVGQQSLHFTRLRLDRSVCSDLGISVKLQESSCVIRSIQPEGLIDHWNHLNPDQEVHVNDRVIEVNGQPATPSWLRSQLLAPGVLELVELDAVLLKVLVRNLRCVVAAATAEIGHASIEKALHQVQWGAATEDIIDEWDMQASAHVETGDAPGWRAGMLIELDEAENMLLPSSPHVASDLRLQISQRRRPTTDFLAAAQVRAPSMLLLGREGSQDSFPPIYRSKSVPMLRQPSLVSEVMETSSVIEVDTFGEGDHLVHV